MNYSQQKWYNNMFCFILFYRIMYDSFGSNRTKETKNVAHLVLPYKTKETFGTT